MAEDVCPRAVLREVANAPKWLRDKMPLDQLSPADRRALAWAWACFERDSQKPPPGDWSVWLLQAGRGFGKTRAGAEWVHRLAMARPGVRIALVGATMHEARSIMVEGVSGLLRVAKLNGARLTWEPSLGKLSWRNGSEAQLFSGENPDGLRGPEHDFAWADELAKWAQPEATWNNLQMGLRRGPRAR